GGRDGGVRRQTRGHFPRERAGSRGGFENVAGVCLRHPRREVTRVIFKYQRDEQPVVKLRDRACEHFVRFRHGLLPRAYHAASSNVRTVAGPSILRGLVCTQRSCIACSAIASSCSGLTPTSRRRRGNPRSAISEATT